jgi:hypothetical protein
MMKKIFVLAVGLFCILFFAFPLTSNAEWMTGVNVGFSVSDDEDIALNSSGIEIAEARFDVDDSFTLGYRIGYWLEPLPWLGLSVDISYFRPDVEFELIYEDCEGKPAILKNTGEFDIVPISPLLMLRIPLGVNQEFPKGRFQPYVAFGPSIFISWFDFVNFDDSDVEIGWDARAGIAAMVAYNIAVFAEYRYTDAEFVLDEHLLVQGVGGIRNELEIDLDTHHFTVGIFYYF